MRSSEADRFSQADLDSMDRALALAGRAYGQTSPNPMVGAVVVRGGAVIGEGFHARAGRPHAEPQALEAARRSVDSHRDSTRDWTLYVNLEPCVHHGRTPPCVETVLAAPVGRVVIAHVDPDPRVAGRGVERLRAAGIRVDVGCREREALELNHAFVARQRRGHAFVALKVALSADGCIAAADGSPATITGPEARAHLHRLRAGLDAILIGVETLRRDRPRLDRRLYDGPGSSPRRLVLDPGLRSDPEWLWPGEPRPVLFCSRQALESRGARLARVAEFVPLPEAETGLDLGALPAALRGLGLYSLLVEGGGRTHLRFLQAGWWDRFYLYRSTVVRLQGLPWEAEEAWLAARGRLVASATTRLGPDEVQVYAHPETRDPE